MTGPAPIFEGEKGFEKLVSGPLPIAGPLRRRAAAASADFMILRHEHQVLARRVPRAERHRGGAGAAPQTGCRDVERIESIIVESHDAAVDIIGSEPEKWRPTSRETADHSLPYMRRRRAGGRRGDLAAVRRPPASPTRNLLALVQRVEVERRTPN